MSNKFKLSIANSKNEFFIFSSLKKAIKSAGKFKFSPWIITISQLSAPNRVWADLIIYYGSGGGIWISSEKIASKLKEVENNE